MKKIFIGLLIIAAGATVYFTFKLNNKPGKHSFHKELIIGKWKLDSLYNLNDSATDFIPQGIADLNKQLKNYNYEFNMDGSIKLWLNDSLTRPELGYDWLSNDQIAWKEYPANKTIEVFKVTILNKDSMLLQSKDSVALYFSKPL